MNVDQLAVLYVHVIEPMLKVLAFFIVVVVLLYLFNALNDSKKKDLRPWKENLFIPRYRKLRGNVGLGLVRLEIIRKGGNQFHLVVVQWAQIEDHLAGLLDGQLQLGLALLEGR